MTVVIKATMFINNMYKLVVFNFEISKMKVAKFHLCTVKTLNIGTPRPATVVALNIKPFNFTMK